MRKLLLVLMMSALCLCAQDQAPAGAPPAGGAPAGGGRGRGGGGFPPGPYKNLKVLTEAELMPSMRMAAQGLGVQCTFCHVPPAYDSDEKKEKVAGRAMFSLTKDLNAKFPDGKPHINCYTCHRGVTTDPVMAPPPAGAGGGRGGGRGGGAQ